MAVKVAFRVLLAALVLCATACNYCADCMETHHWQIFRGVVKDLDSGKTLLTVCANAYGTTRSDKMRFKADPGTTVEEEILLQGVYEQYRRGQEPARDDAFWCSGSPKKEAYPLRPAGCFKVADADPPATILRTQSRGDVKQLTTGYALTLEIRHPGTLHLSVDSQCKPQPLTSDAAALTKLDASTPLEKPFPELTIL